MVTKNNCLSCLIDNRLLNLGRCRCHRSSGFGTWCWRWSAQWLRILGSSFLLLAHRKVECQKQWNNRKSDHHKSGKALSAAEQNTSDFICNWEKQMNARRNARVSLQLGQKLFGRPP